MRISGRALDLGLAAFAAALLGASAWLTPAGDDLVLPGGSPIGGLCWFRATFHVDCPFCGTTRSFVAMAHGDVAAAFRFHPAGPLMFAALVVALVALLAVGVRRARPLVERPRFVRAVQAVTVVCLSIGVFHVVKNVVMQMVRS